MDSERDRAPLAPTGAQPTECDKNPFRFPIPPLLVTGHRSLATASPTAAFTGHRPLTTGHCFFPSHSITGMLR